MLALRIDVDFAAGLDRALPGMLDVLARHRLRATFLVVAGSNRPSRSIRRLANPSYLRRLSRLGPRAIVRGLRGSLAGDGRLLRTEHHRQVIRRLLDEGHELAVHGYDHAWWAEQVWRASRGQLEEEIERGFSAMREAAGVEVAGWGSPNWRTRKTVLEALARRGVPYFAECWGRRPFLSIDTHGAPIPIPHLPVTLSSLESLVLERGLNAAEAVAAMLDAHRPGSVDVACLHDYFEGLLRPDLFDAFAAACARRELRTVPLIEAAQVLRGDLERLPRCDLTRAPVPGFVGEVSWQADR